ncbi:MAG: ABC transporter permease [Phycisphaeraceae bacterium]
MSATATTRPPLPNPAELVTIEARQGWQRLDLAGLWRYRDLWWALLVRDVQVRYKQTVLGAAWAILQPLAMMVVIAMVLGKVLGMDAKVPGSYALFLYAGMIPWVLFRETVQNASNSLVNNAEMLRKIYFPRLLLPLSAVGTPVVDFLSSMFVLLGLAALLGDGFSLSLMWLPLAAMSLLIVALGVAVPLSAMVVSYRDFRLIVPLMLQMGMFLSPVMYPLPLPTRWEWLVCLNPMHGPLAAFRAAVLGQPIDFPLWICGTAMGMLGLMMGLAWFVRLERRFADVV